MFFKRGKDDPKPAVKPLVDHKAGGSFNDAAPQILSGAAADDYFRNSKAWKAMLGEMTELGHAAPDPASNTRLRVRSGNRRTYLDLPNDRIELLHGENVFVLQAQNGGSVFKGKPISYQRDGVTVESFAPTHYSTAPAFHAVQVFDTAGREIADPQQRNQKILRLMAAMAHQKDPHNKWDYFGDLKDLAQKTGLRPATAPFQPVLKTEHSVLPVRIMKPVSLRPKTGLTS